jgi:hypothetical protein
MSGREIHSTEKVAHVLGRIQRVLESEGIPSWIGGGVGADLLRSEVTPEEQPRLHRDGDMYIPFRRRLEAIEVLAKNGVAIDYLHDTPVIIWVQVGDVDVDLFSISDEPGQPVVRQIHQSDLVASDRHETPALREPFQQTRKQVSVNLTPEIVTIGDQNLKVLGAQSLKDIATMKENLTQKTIRDIQILDKVISKRR